MYLSINNGADSAQGILCSRDPKCNITFNEDSVRDCCVQEGVLTYQDGVGERCRRCYGSYYMLNINNIRQLI